MSTELLSIAFPYKRGKTVDESADNIVAAMMSFLTLIKSLDTKESFLNEWIVSAIKPQSIQNYLNDKFKTDKMFDNLRILKEDGYKMLPSPGYNGVGDIFTAISIKIQRIELSLKELVEEIKKLRAKREKLTIKDLKNDTKIDGFINEISQLVGIDKDKIYNEEFLDEAKDEAKMNQRIKEMNNFIRKCFGGSKWGNAVGDFKYLLNKKQQHALEEKDQKLVNQFLNLVEITINNSHEIEKVIKENEIKGISFKVPKNSKDYTSAIKGINNVDLYFEALKSANKNLNSFKKRIQTLLEDLNRKIFIAMKVKKTTCYKNMEAAEKLIPSLKKIKSISFALQ